MILVEMNSLTRLNISFCHRSAVMVHSWYFRSPGCTHRQLFNRVVHIILTYFVSVIETVTSKYVCNLNTTKQPKYEPVKQEAISHTVILLLTK